MALDPSSVTAHTDISNPFDFGVRLLCMGSTFNVMGLPKAGPLDGGVSEVIGPPVPKIVPKVSRMHPATPYKSTT
jgi:hypothetical protein